MPDLITPEEAARRLGLEGVARDPRLVVLRMARRGELRAVRVSKWTLITRASVERYTRTG